MVCFITVNFTKQFHEQKYQNKVFFSVFDLIVEHWRNLSTCAQVCVGECVVRVSESVFICKVEKEWESSGSVSVCL